MVIETLKDTTTHTDMSGFDSSDDEEREYDTTTLKIDWLDLSKYDLTEPLGISGLPGCKFKETWRNLSTDIGTLKSEGVKDVFVLCSRGELHKYRVPTLLDDLAAAELNVHAHPFPDGQTPPAPSLIKMVDAIRVNLAQGRKCLVHCFGGLGRSALVAVCLLLSLDEDMDAEAGIATLRRLRGPRAVQSVKQYNFINEFRKTVEDFEKDREETARSVSR